MANPYTITTPDFSNILPNIIAGYIGEKNRQAELAQQGFRNNLAMEEMQMRRQEFDYEQERMRQEAQERQARAAQFAELQQARQSLFAPQSVVTGAGPLDGGYVPTSAGRNALIAPDRNVAIERLSANPLLWGDDNARQMVNMRFPAQEAQKESWLAPSEGIWQGKPAYVQVESSTGRVRPIEGLVPQEKKPLVQVSTGDGGQGLKYSDVASMRNDFNKESKTYFDVRESFGRIKSAAGSPSAAGDLALIFSFMKMLDPGSTVREGEFANAQNAGGVPDRVIALYNKATKGERLSESQRADFMRQATNQFKTYENRQRAVVNKYKKISSQYRVDPALVLEEVEAQQEPTPANIVEFGGKRYIKKDGKWFEE